MKLTIEKQALLRKLLGPISKVTENCILTVTPSSTGEDPKYGFTQCIATSPDGAIILYIKQPTEAIATEVTTLNIPNVRKLLQVFDCIDDPYIDLKVESNHLAYNASNIKFKYFLLDDGVIEMPPVKAEKIEALKFNCSFDLGSKTIKELLKGSSFTADTNKIYFYTKDDGVYAELTDQTIQNSDSITFRVAGSYDGDEVKQVLPLNMDIIRLIGDLKAEKVTVNINTENKVLMFENSEGDYSIKYIVSSLVK